MTKEKFNYISKSRKNSYIHVDNCTKIIYENTFRLYGVAIVPLKKNRKNNTFLGHVKSNYRVYNNHDYLKRL